MNFMYNFPCITIEEKADNFVVCEQCCEYVPHLYAINSQYAVDWVDEEGVCIRYIKAITPEQAIRNAFKWCLDKGLITNPTYIK